MIALIQTLVLALDIYWWILIASAIFSWLYAFNVVNPRNQFVGSVGNFLFRITEPVLAPIRRMMPDLGGIDISPIIVLLIILFFLRQFLLTTVLVARRVSAPPAGPFFRLRDDGVDLFVRLTPRSSADEIGGTMHDCGRQALSARPCTGRSGKRPRQPALHAARRRSFRLPSSAVTIASG